MSKSFDHYYNSYISRMFDIEIHNDFKKILEWVKDKPGYVTSIRELASVISDHDEPSVDAIRAAIGTATMLTTWPEALGETYFEVIAENGKVYPVENLSRQMLAGQASYVIEDTGELIKDVPSRIIPRIRIVDFDPAMKSEFKT